MNKTALALVIAIPVIAYPVASWVMGGQIDALFVKQYAEVEDNEVFKFADRKIERGIFSSEEVLTVELKPEFMELWRTETGGEAPQAALEPVRLVFRSHIKHGPLPGFSSMGLGTAYTELEVNHPLVTKLYAGKSPLTFDTSVDFSGSTHQRLRSPAVEHLLADGIKISWAELVMDTSTDRNMSDWSYKGSLPFIKVDDPVANRRMQMDDFAFEGQQKRLLADDLNLYTGPVKVTLRSMEVQETSEGQPPMRLNNMLVQTDATEKAGFMDITAGYTIESLQIGDDSYKNAHFDLALRHLEVKALAELHKLGQTINTNSESDLGLDQFKPMLRPLQALLENSPEISIERMGVTTPEGEIKASAIVKLPNANVGNLGMVVENPLVLMGLAAVVEANAELAIPLTLLMANLNEEQAAMLPSLLEIGYVKDNNGQLSTSVSYVQSKVTINGQPIDPGMMMGAGAGE